MNEDIINRIDEATLKAVEIRHALTRPNIDDDVSSEARAAEAWELADDQLLMLEELSVLAHGNQLLPPEEVRFLSRGQLI